MGNGSAVTMTLSEQTGRWLRVGIILVIVTMLYNIAEAVIALWAGTEAASIALIEFGLNSIIELTAAGVLLWRLRLEFQGAALERVERADRRVHQFVGASFFALAVYVVGQASWMLWRQEAPQESFIGIILACLSLTIMPLISLGKLRAAAIVGSRALRAEAKETLACSYLSFTLLLGLGANAAVGWWWADPIAALGMVPWLIKEGKEGLLEEHCGEHEEETAPKISHA